MMDFINSVTNDVLAVAMDGHLARQKAIASNIANASTPNYKHRDVDFQGALKKSLAGVRSGKNQGVPLASNEEGLSMQGVLPSHFGVLLESGEGSANAIKKTPIEVSANDDFIYRNDGNCVDLEREMVLLAKNASRFKSLTKLQAKLNNQLRGVLNNTQG
ncbi:MAG: flagellar basal body rod protein FlgB [Candidatus Melainabacteria bacterium]|jgi:flagellar basal-body rod protein FlgB|nr:flagellar basal body rod protein FlgB [Candidatus Melainabacteria bacterium]